MPPTTAELHAVHVRLQAHCDLPTAERSEEELDRIAAEVGRVAGGEYRPNHNGWTNRETWNASLWISNDPETYEPARRIVREAMDGSDYDTRGMMSPADDRRYQLRYAGEALGRWWTDRYLPRTGPMSDAWQYAMAVTDWTAVAEGLAEDMPAAGSGYLP